MDAQQAAAGSQAPAVPRRARDRRQGYRIAPGFQNRFRLTLMLVALFVAAIELGLAKAVSYLVDHPHLLDGPFVPFWLAATTLALAACVVKVCDRVSHRVAGPAYRLRRSLEAVRRGERIRPIVLRDGDELQDLAEALNAALQQLGAMDDPES